MKNEKQAQTNAVLIETIKTTQDHAVLLQLWDQLLAQSPTLDELCDVWRNQRAIRIEAAPVLLRFDILPDDIARSVWMNLSKPVLGEDDRPL